MTPVVDRQSQLLRGALDMCLLALLAEEPCHAYELTKRLAAQGVTDVGYGTLYPLGTRLRRQGLVEERTEPSSTGPPRKVFTPSAAGRRALADWAAQWWSTTAAVTALLTRTGVLPLPEESA